MKTRSKSIRESYLTRTQDGSLDIVKCVWLTLFGVLAVVSLAGAISGAMHNLITFFISIFVFFAILFTNE